MKVKRFFPIGCAIVLAASLLAHGEIAPAPGQTVASRVARLTAILSLTTAQQASATTIFTTEQTSLSTLRTSLTTDRTALQTAIEANDANGIATAAAEIGALTTQEVQAIAQAEAAFYALLTIEQQTKYKLLLQAGEFGPPGGGPHPGH